MKLRRRQFLNLAAGAAAHCLLFIGMPGHSAWSQTSQTYKIIVPYAPGGAGSVLARVLADHIERSQASVTVVVENRPGAGTAIGTEAVARATPNGNTLLINNGSMILSSLLQKQSYDPVKSFEPICRLASTALFITVNSASSIRTLTDLLNAARATPGRITAASFPANTGQVSIEWLKHRANVDITFVPFAGSAPAVTALLGGHVTALVDNYATVAEHVQAGKLRVLATVSRERSEAQPDVPTVAETGFEGYGLDSWWSLFAPAKSPNATVVQLANWMTAALHSPEVKQKLDPMGFYPAVMCGPEFATYFQNQVDGYGRSLREANMKSE
jgi:tripartite-type tricarboxylate transporter receptor subunit TctC